MAASFERRAFRTTLAPPGRARLPTGGFGQQQQGMPGEQVRAGLGIGIDAAHLRKTQQRLQCDPRCGCRWQRRMERSSSTWPGNRIMQRKAIGSEA